MNIFVRNLDYLFANFEKNFFVILYIFMVIKILQKNFSEYQLQRTPWNPSFGGVSQGIKGGLR